MVWRYLKYRKWNSAFQLGGYKLLTTVQMELGTATGYKHVNEIRVSKITKMMWQLLSIWSLYVRKSLNVNLLI